MKKHLLATLCVGILVSLPACIGSCGKKKEEMTSERTSSNEQVEAVQTDVQAQAPVEGDAAAPVAPEASEVNKI